MKTIGIIGGTSWVSSAEYYRIINESVSKRLGGWQSGKIILFSVNYGDIKSLTDRGDWEGIAVIMIDAAQKLELAGADCVVIGANTMHKIADQIQEAINIPIIHIAEVVATIIGNHRLSTVALLGTRFTMELDFYRNILAKSGIDTIIPEANERDFIHATIYDEMGKGIFLKATKSRYLQIIDTLKKRGAQAVILGCTEIPLLIKQEDCSIPVLDTTAIHCEAAVDFALKEIRQEAVH